MKKYLILFLILFIGLASAHLPRLVYDDNLSSPLNVENPEVSQAFYGELKGAAEYYRISSDSDFNFYSGLLSPVIEDSKTNFKAEISFGDELILLEKNETWEKFYEEFAGDDYFEGPEIEFNASAGDYLIKVYNEENKGKYVLVVGKIESFTLGETVKTYFNLPLLKIYFEKSPLTAYFNILGIGLLVFLIILAGIIVGVYFVIKKLKKK